MELDAPSYMGSCAADSATKEPDCGWYTAQRVELSETNSEGLAGLARDPRITSVIAINSEYLAALGTPPADVSILHITLGNPDGTSDGNQITQAVAIPGASIFDAFAVCTAAGPDILIEEDGDSSLCGASREARQSIHQEVSEAIIAFLNGEAE